MVVRTSVAPPDLHLWGCAPHPADEPVGVASGAGWPGCLAPAARARLTPAPAIQSCGNPPRRLAGGPDSDDVSPCRRCVRPPAQSVHTHTVDAVAADSAEARNQRNPGWVLCIVSSRSFAAAAPHPYRQETRLPARLDCTRASRPTSALAGIFHGPLPHHPARQAEHGVPTDHSSCPCLFQLMPAPRSSLPRPGNHRASSGTLRGLDPRFQWTHQLCACVRSVQREGQDHASYR